MLQKPKRINFVPWTVLILFLIPHLCFSADLRQAYEAAENAYNQGQYDQAILLYKQINKEMPQFAPAYIGVGLALKAQGADIDEVIYYYKTAVDKDPNNIQILDQMARLYYSIGQLSKAQAVFEKIIKINPNMPDVKLSLGWIDLMGKKTNPERAIKYLKDVIKTSPNPSAYFGLGIAYFADNQREKALDMITQLKGMGQDDYATKLETAVRENRNIIANNLPDEAEDQTDASNDSSQDDIEKTPDVPKGVKVRLRGKLNDQ